jgi:hypothetical protein
MYEPLGVCIEELEQEIDGIPRVERVEEHVGETANASSRA